MRFITVLALVIVAISGRSVPAGAGTYSEYEVKAAFLLNFARLIQWPDSAFPDAQDPIVLGVLGKDPFEGTLEDLVADKKVGTRSIKVRRVARLADVPSCHIVFVSAPEPSPVKEIVAAAQGTSVLLIGDSQDFARHGGAINFYVEEGKVRFAINRRAAEAAGLKISSRMLRLAKLVTDDNSAAPAVDRMSVSSADAMPDLRLHPDRPIPLRDL
jgi:hypothetical protein